MERERFVLVCLNVNGKRVPHKRVVPFSFTFAICILTIINLPTGNWGILDGVYEKRTFCPSLSRMEMEKRVPHIFIQNNGNCSKISKIAT